MFLRNKKKLKDFLSFDIYNITKLHKIKKYMRIFLLETIYRLEANFSILLNVLKGDLEL